MNQLNIGIIGGSRASDKALALAYEAGKEIAWKKWVLYCGGRSGIMEAASRGAHENKGIVIGILPGLSREHANPYLTYSIPTGLGHLRNQIVVCSSDIILAFEGSAGTLSEVALANIYNRTVISIGSWELPVDPLSKEPLFKATFDSIKAAFSWIEKWLSDK